jgi:cobalt-zinc-cadmium resistance protein CzcA
MAFTIAFAIFGAFILSITYVPMMAALFLNKKLNHKKNITDRLMIWLERSYQPFLKMVLKIPKTVIGVTVLLFFVSVGLLMNMGGEFIPQLEEGDFAVETRVLTGSNLNNTIASTQKATKLLLQNFPEVEKIVTKIGSAEIPTDPMPFEAGDMMVILKDKKEWTSAKTFSELSMKMTKVLEQVPGITVGFQFPVQMRFNELMTGARQDVVCKIFGENLDTLTHYAARLNQIIQTVDGAVNIYEEKVTGMPQVVIKYNRDGMAKYGLNVEDVNRVVNSAFAGQIAGQVYEEEKRFDMVVRLDGESRKSLADIQNLNITTANGMQIPLSFVAGIEEIEGVNQIQRENTKRRIIVGFNINGRDVQTIVNELQTKIGQQLNLQKGYTIVYGGSFENMTAAKNKLSIVVPIALFLIFLLLYFAFGSVKQGLLIYTAIPLSAMGGIMALWARSMPFSISAGVGFIALFGVAVLNGILLVTEFNRLKSEGWHDITRIVIHATKSKLRAVLMTALVPALGFIPMAISTGAGGEVQKPLATVVIGGLIISTLLTLFVLPVMYLLFEKGTKYLTMNKNASITILILLLFGQVSFAQNKISLTSAIDTALKNNTALRASNLNVDYYKALRKSNVDIDKTLFDFGYGKINSFQNDNRILISQNIQFPSVYKSQGAINKSNLLMSELSKLTNEIELKSLVKNKYYLLLVLQNKKQLLMQADSIYSAFVTKANQRYNAGGADVLEKVTAESQLAQISNQLQTLTLSYENSINEFNYLLNSTQAFEPASAKLEILLAQLPDVYAIQQTPIVQMGAQKVVLAENQQKLEKGKLQPDFNVGYNSSTIIGWQPTTQGSDSYFGSNHRFGAINLGLSIPIFSTAQKSKIAASKVQIEQNKLENIALQQQLNSNFKNLLNSYLQNKKLVMAYEKNTLPNAALLIETAGRKMTAGEITYLEWVMIINQAIQIKSEYLNYIQQLNENVIELEKLTATK